MELLAASPQEYYLIPQHRDMFDALYAVVGTSCRAMGAAKRPGALTTYRDCPLIGGLTRR